jgi:hypothetical protein
LDPVKVRCVKILRGGRLDGEEIEQSWNIHIGGEYVVLGMRMTKRDGLRYLVLRDVSKTLTAIWPAQMFEIVSGKISRLWEMEDAYGTHVLFVLQPAEWHDAAWQEGMDRRDPEVLRRFNELVAVMYEEEGERPPLALEDLDLE